MERDSAGVKGAPGGDEGDTGDENGSIGERNWLDAIESAGDTMLDDMTDECLGILKACRRGPLFWADTAFCCWNIWNNWSA